MLLVPERVRMLMIGPDAWPYSALNILVSTWNSWTESGDSVPREPSVVLFSWLTPST